MSALELGSLLTQISPESPSGEDLAYDPAFDEMVRAAKGQEAETMVGSKDPIDPDWKGAASLALGLLSRTKDLRVAVILTRSLFHMHGFSGLRNGLTLTRRLLTEFWDSVHPQLDPDDDMDPTARLNALMDLRGRETLLNPVRTTPLVTSRVFGPVTIRDLEIAGGKAPQPAATEAPTLDAASIKGAFQECELVQLRDAASAVAAAKGEIEQIESAIVGHADSSQAPDFAPLSGLLTEANTVLQEQLRERMAQESPTATSVPEASLDEPGGTPTPAGNNPRSRIGAIGSREDAVRMMDKICDYYARNEPSSPVPLLLQRARRLATKDFMEIMRDLLPGSLKQIEAIRGPEEDQ